MRPPPPMPSAASLRPPRPAACQPSAVGWSPPPHQACPCHSPQRCPWLAQSGGAAACSCRRAALQRAAAGRSLRRPPLQPPQQVGCSCPAARVQMLWQEPAGLGQVGLGGGRLAGLGGRRRLETAPAPVAAVLRFLADHQKLRSAVPTGLGVQGREGQAWVAAAPGGWLEG